MVWLGKPSCAEKIELGLFNKQKVKYESARSTKGKGPKWLWKLGTSTQK